MFYRISKGQGLYFMIVVLIYSSQHYHAHYYMVYTAYIDMSITYNVMYMHNIHNVIHAHKHERLSLILLKTGMQDYIYMPILLLRHVHAHGMSCIWKYSLQLCSLLTSH